MITHYDLFAGIGGFSLALDTVFYDEKIKHIFSEWEPFPTAILKKHWPHGTYYGDIRDLVADTAGERLAGGFAEPTTEGRNWVIGRSNENKKQGLVILTGGFPCQPFSHAGRRKGTADDRYLWPPMLSVIRNVRPDWVIAENVRGLVTWNDGMVLETVCSDLESEGYEVQPLVIPACAVGAPHRRDRVWIVGYAKGERGKSEERSVCKGENPYDCRGTDTTLSKWNQDWREVAFATCHDGVDDGLPRQMDGVTISASRHRRERLKACGNAIVPQVAMQIFRAIKES